jgi:hypothetical protein
MGMKSVSFVSAGFPDANHTHVIESSRPNHNGSRAAIKRADSDVPLFL